MVTWWRCSILLVGASAVYACAPEFDDRPSLVGKATAQDEVRVLAIKSEPAEYVKVIDPNTGLAATSKFTALVATRAGTVTSASVDWTFCNEPKPLTELNDVSVRCVTSSEFSQPIGNGISVSATVPDDACRNFGPDVPVDQSFRPADPDITGGYYQPLRALVQLSGGVVSSVGRYRLRCGLPGASPIATTEYNRNYHLNTNPVIDNVTALLPGGPVMLQPSDADPKPAPITLAPNQVVTMRAAWAPCPLMDACGDGVCGPTETKQVGDGNCAADCSPTEKGCSGAERFLTFSLVTRAVTEDREIMTVSWFAGFGGGSFASDRTGRDTTDFATTTDNDFTAPTTPGVYPIWAVIRDDRGGQSWQSYEIQVQ